MGYTGIPHFITTTHREGCTLCNEYTAHTLKTAKTPVVEVLHHCITLAFQRAWPHAVTCMIDEASSEVKDTVDYWHNQCYNLTASIKSAKDKLSSEKD